MALQEQTGGIEGGDQLSRYRRRATAVAAIIATLCIAQGLASNLGAASPLCGADDPAWPARLMAGQFARADEMFRSVAGAHGLLLVIPPAKLDTGSENLLTQLYFRAAYTLFPNRVLVGHDDHVINNWDQLAVAAAEVPDRSWLRSHHVDGILTLSISADGALVTRAESVQ